MLLNLFKLFRNTDQRKLTFYVPARTLIEDFQLTSWMVICATVTKKRPIQRNVTFLVVLALCCNVTLNIQHWAFYRCMLLATTISIRAIGGMENVDCISRTWTIQCYSVSITTFDSKHIVWPFQMETKTMIMTFRINLNFHKHFCSSRSIETVLVRKFNPLNCG